MKSDLLLIVDMQNDFSDSGTIAVKGANLLSKKIFDFYFKFSNKLYVGLSADNHPINHVSFKIWPKHCIKNTYGNKFIDPLNRINPDILIKKGSYKKIENYSCYYNGNKPTKLFKFLIGNKIKIVYLCGLVKEYCVLETAIDLINNNFCVYVIDDLTLSLDPINANLLYKKHKINLINLNYFERQFI